MSATTENNQSPVYIPTLKITPNSIIGYYQYEGPRSRKNILNNFYSLGREEVKAYSGEITSHSVKRLKQACELLFVLARKKSFNSRKTGKRIFFRIALHTLTLSAPQGEWTDKQIKEQLLKPYLRHFKSKGLVNYIWKAERQMNGNIHFHILTDAFIDKTEVRNYWNKVQAKFGLITKFEQKHGHRDPNSTDVKVVRNDQGMTNYMLKYMLKEVEKEGRKEEGQEIEEGRKGKIWDCSVNLKIKNDTANMAEDWEFELIEKKVDEGHLEKIETDFCTIYRAKGKDIWDIAPSTLASRIINYLRKVRAFGSLEEWEEKHRKYSSVAFGTENSPLRGGLN